MSSETAADSVQVVKVGGSLLTLTDLRGRLASWLGSADRPTVLLAGGGRLVDEVRDLTSRFGIPDEPAHWLALRAMTLQSHFLATLLADTPVVTAVDGCRRWRDQAAGQVIFDPYPLLWADRAQSLPASWAVTSDSIAAFLAHRLKAERLVLLKSVGGLQPLTIAEATAEGWLDAYFPRVAGQLHVEWVNLRQGLQVSLTP